MQSINTIIDHRHRILRVTTHINNHLDKKILLEQLSDLACFSPFHFIRVFDAIMGDSPQQYVFKKRMEQAGFNLLKVDLSVTDVTFSVAYQTPSSFCKAFNSYYGLSPRKFRDSTTEDYYHRSHNTFRSVRKVRHKARNVLLPVIKFLPPLKVIYIKNRGAKAANFVESAPHSFRKFRRKITEEGLTDMIGSQISVYPYRPSNFKDPKALSFVGATINKKIERIPGFKYLTLPAGKYAIFGHFGPFDFMVQTWNQAYSNWLPRSRQHLRDAPPVELHVHTGSSQNPLQLNAYLMVPIH